VCYNPLSALDMIKDKSIVILASIILITIFGTYFFSYISFITLQNEIPHSILDIWYRWDASPYIKIAKYWYTTSTVEDRNLTIVFFPLYPIVIKLFSVLFQDYLLSALVVSNIGYAFSVYFLYRLVLLDYPNEIAIKATVYLSIFPSAYFLHAAYTESLFLALTMSSFYYARREKWLVSSILAMFASVTRITGIFLIPSLIIEYLYQKNFKIKQIKWNIFWITLILLGPLSYLLINYMTFDDAFKFLEFQRHTWQKSLSSPHLGYLTARGIIASNDPSYKVLTGWAELIFIFIGLLSSIWVLIRLRLSYGIYMFITWIALASTSFWLSTPRYTLSMFPLFIALSIFGKNSGINYLITFISLLFYALFLSIYVQGRWAF